LNNFLRKIDEIYSLQGFRVVLFYSFLTMNKMKLS